MRIALIHVVDCSTVPGMAPELQRPPAEMYSIAAILRSFKLDVEIVEIYARSRDEMLGNVQKVAKKLRPELAGMSCQTFNRYDVTDAAQAMKEINPKTRIVLHGPHATAMSKQMLDVFPQIDGVILGEAEGTYLEYAQKLNALAPVTVLRGLARRADDGRVLQGAARRPAENLDWLPAPGKFLDYAHVLTSRGCPEGRGYMAEAAIFGDRLRFRSPASVLEELRLLREHYGREVLFFADEDFTASRDHALAICRGIVESGLKLSFEVNSHPDHICEERLKWLKKAGCFRITYSVESGAEAVLRALGRTMDIANAVEMCHLTRRHGIHARYRMILGAPGETRETIEETKRFIERSRPSSTVVQMMAIYPGTPLYEAGRKNGEIDEGVWLKREARTVRHWPKELEGEQEKTIRDFVEFARVHSYTFSAEERAFFTAEYPDSVDHFARGRRNLERGNLQEAIAEYELQVQGARDANAAISGLIELAKCYVLIGAYSPALNTLRSADRLLQPEDFSYPKTIKVNPVVTGLMAECYANLREYAECRAATEQLLAAIPEHPYGRYLMSLCLLDGPNPDKERAAAECRRALELGYKVPQEYLKRAGVEIPAEK